MSDDHHDDVPRPERPGAAVLWGVLSLVGVTLLVGGVLAGGALVATRLTGLSSGGGGEQAAATTAQETLVVPEPTELGGLPEPDVTLSDVPEPPLPSSTVTEDEEAEGAISLDAGATQVGAGETIPLTGTYPGGDGATLLVERFEGGAWADFAGVTAAVNNGQFSTYVLTSRPGVNRFRLVDTGTGEASNEVRVTVG